jgi:hypothetical protein
MFNWTHVTMSRDLHLLSSSAEQGEIGRERMNIEDEISKPWAFQTLHALKDHLFITQDSTLDAFVSLYFRTPGLAVPKSLYFPGCKPSPAPQPLISPLYHYQTPNSTACSRLIRKKQRQRTWSQSRPFLKL